MFISPKYIHTIIILHLIWLKSTGEDTTRKVSLIGKEKDGVLIIARSHIERDYGTKTSIYLYDYKSHKTRIIYKHNVPNISVIGATVNDERSLLAFVTESMNDRN